VAAALALAHAGQERKQQTGYENHIAAHASGVQFMTPQTARLRRGYLIQNRSQSLQSSLNPGSRNIEMRDHANR
jgi:hypothetical protein